MAYANKQCCLDFMQISREILDLHGGCRMFLGWKNITYEESVWMCLPYDDAFFSFSILGKGEFARHIKSLFCVVFSVPWCDPALLI